MELLNTIFDWLMGLNSVVFIAIMFFVISLIFGNGLKSALRAGLYFGGGLVGVNTIMAVAINIMTPIAEGISSKLGTDLSVVDIGYGAHPATLAWPGAVIVFFAIFIISFILVSCNVINTILTDPHNVWHGLWFGAMAYALTGKLWFAIILCTIFLVFFLFLADYHAKGLQEFNEIPNITFISCAVTLPLTFAHGCMKIINKIPKLRDIHAETEDIKDKFGIFGETVTIGFMLGLVLSLISGSSFSDSLYQGIALGASLALFPRMAGFLLEGIVPMTNGITAFMKKKFPGRNINITVDVAVLLGNPSVMTSFVIIVPIVIVLNIILPGINFIPIASLSAVPYFMGAMVPATKGNVVHNVIIGVLWCVLCSYVASFLAPDITATVANGGLFTEQIADGAVFACWDEGGNVLGLIVKFLSGFFK